jgi:hypothetical protein
MQLHSRLVAFYFFSIVYKNSNSQANELTTTLDTVNEVFILTGARESSNTSFKRWQH